MLPVISSFSQAGHFLMYGLLLLAWLAAGWGLVNICSSTPLWQRGGGYLLWGTVLLLVTGFAMICWLHYQIYLLLPLKMEANLVAWLNQQLEAMNSTSAYAFPLYDPANPPRYTIPVWIENEKYYFWFMCYAGFALSAYYRLKHHRLRAVLHLFLAVQLTILFFAVDPFAQPLAKFFSEIGFWFDSGQSAMSRLGLFMKLYPRMIFYYNAHYMWLHPPLLFLSYGCITLTFIASSFMLVRREPAIEVMGYDFAKLGYFMLTLGMLLGYPWALQAWGPNWWWDPKICSSLMLWAVFSTYLHTRLYANKPAMWYFTSCLGILSFLAMIFTFMTSFFFPGEHTFQ